MQGAGLTDTDEKRVTPVPYKKPCNAARKTLRPQEKLCGKMVAPRFLSRCKRDSIIRPQMYQHPFANCHKLTVNGLT
jgi:hypothetical protein